MAQAKVEGRFVRESEAAVLIKQDEGEFWLPKSQISYQRRDADDSYECRIPAWLAAKKDGLDYEEVD